MGNWIEKIPANEITGKITNESVSFASRFGNYLGRDEENSFVNKEGKSTTKVVKAKLTTTQLRKFFGEIKRQQLKGYDPTDFILLKPKLAYAVGRVKDENAKINDFYYVISDAIDQVNNETSFINFIKIFEAIVAYHKASEESKLNDNK